MHRRVVEQSAAAGGTLAAIEIPQGLVVAAVIHNGRVIVPRGDQKLEVGDEVILFVRHSEAWMAQLVFPGPEGV
jgi:Trk K+ transport system NAD-binding subunit